MSIDRRAHWEDVYGRKTEDQVSWFEADPALSLALIRAAGFGPEASVVDIGGGASRLAGALKAAGHAHVAVVDLSAAALDAAKARLDDAGGLDWIVADVTAWTPPRHYDVWHDRAAFHFLTSEADRRAYARALDAALRPGGAAIIGTFAPDGPETCSGLPVMRHDGASLQAVLGDGYALEAERRHAHKTPWGAVQRFQFSTFRKRRAAHDSPSG